MKHTLSGLENSYITFLAKGYTEPGTPENLKKRKRTILQLARLGLPQAVEHYYHYFKRGENPKIDAIIDSYSETSSSYEELWAIGTRSYNAQDKQKAKAIAKEISSLHKEYLQCLQGKSKRSLIEISQEIKEKENEYIEIPFLKYKLTAFKLALKQATENNNYLILERANRMRLNLNEYNTDSDGMRNLLKRFNKTNKKIVKALMAENNKRRKCLPGYNPSADPAFAYCLASACMASENKKLKEFAFSIMKELASRPYTEINPNDSILARVKQIRKQKAIIS